MRLPPAESKLNRNYRVSAPTTFLGSPVILEIRPTEPGWTDRGTMEAEDGQPRGLARGVRHYLSSGSLTRATCSRSHGRDPGDQTRPQGVGLGAASACGVGRSACLRTGWGAVRAWDCDPGQPVHSWIHVELRSKQGLARRAMRPVVFLYPLDTR
jgi:hypothetical protein